MDELGYRFVVKALPAEGARPDEFVHYMRPHPLTYQELPHDPEYVLYNSRLTPSRLSSATTDELYWKLRREVVLRHTGILPIEIAGPDAETLLDRVFTRDISRTRVGRCTYQFACDHDGGMINDGLLLRLEPDRFWMTQAEGELFNWYRANASGLDVEITDPEVWVSQVQGPRALDVLARVVDGAPPEPFRYFDIAEATIAGQPVVISRSGYTNELGWECYLPPDIDHAAVGDRILEEGEPLGMALTTTGGFRARRIEAGLRMAGADFDRTVTPFEAGLGAFVNLDKGDFIGRAALSESERRCRTWGMRVDGGIAALGRVMRRDGGDAGRVCSSGWSPFQRCGVAVVRIDRANGGPGDVYDVECTDGEVHTGELCDLPMYDEERRIPRGDVVDIPQVTP